MGGEARKNLSIAQSTKNRGGRCKWFEVSGQKVQGTWERDLAMKMDAVGIIWVKCSKSIPYEIEGKIKRYTPDFYLPEFDHYLELKGYWWGNDKEKMEAVLSQHPHLRIVIVEKEDYLQALNA
jgi:hypothetical protein